MAYNPSTNIVVSGKTFTDVPSVLFKTPDGSTVNFAHVGGQIRFSPTLEEQTQNVANYEDAIIDPITSTLLNQLDSDFVAENIKKDVDLFGLLGTMEAGGGVKIASGTIVLSEPSSKVEFTHNFGEGANFLTIFTSESSVNSAPGLFLLITSRRRTVIARNNSSGSKIVNINVGKNSGSATSDVTTIIGNKPTTTREYNIYSDDTKIYINGFMEEGMSHRLIDGVEYIWLASTWSDD